MVTLVFGFERGIRRDSFCAVVLLIAAATADAQSTWNYFISDAGGGNSLLTWNVSGDLTTPPGPVHVVSQSRLVISVNAPGIFADAFGADGTPNSIPTPDGSFFQLNNTTVFAAISGYEANNAPGSGNDSFGLVAPLLDHNGDPGIQFLYNAGTQSALIPIDYSSFNPGTYQSQQFQFSTPVTVNLTVGPVPEPSVRLFLCTLSVLGVRQQNLFSRKTHLQARRLSGAGH